MHNTSLPSDAFPRQNARTQGFSLGSPRSIAIVADGETIYFLRSDNGEDPVNALWKVQIQDGKLTREELVADPRSLSFGESGVELPSEERRRRERLRERSSGITGYSVTPNGRRVAFALQGELHLVEGGRPRCLLEGRAVYDPRLSPDGRYVAYVSGGSLECIDLESPQAAPKILAESDSPDVTWGVADFAAAEEMHRTRGYWWSPDGARLIVSRVDNRPVDKWYICDPARPDAEPHVVRYPAAGTSNAVVGLSLIDPQTAQITNVSWDGQEFPYLANVSWRAQRPLIAVQSRDQKHCHFLEIDPATGNTAKVGECTDEHWVEIVPGLPAQLDDGKIIAILDDKTRRLTLDGRPITPAHLNVRQFNGRHSDGTVIFEAWDDTPRSWQVWAATTDGRHHQLSSGDAIHGAVVGGRTLVMQGSGQASIDPARPQVHQWKDGRLQLLGEIESFATRPPYHPRPAWVTDARHGIEAAVVFPSGYDGRSPLPVLMSPYGGPGAQYAVASSRAFLSAQWFADAGFAVVVADGRGAPGRGPGWEKAIHGDLLTPALEGQISALRAVSKQYPQLDTARVGIRGWSFGGYLAAAAVIHHPNIFAAAIAGAPVTDWRLYDTHYTERYLGMPHENAEAYDRASLLTSAHLLERPLQIIHGLSDDNVVFAHSLKLSSALLAAGRPHEFLPLSGVTHMASQEDVAENLLKLQLEFLRRHLSATPQAHSSQG